MGGLSKKFNIIQKTNKKLKNNIKNKQNIEKNNKKTNFLLKITSLFTLVVFSVLTFCGCGLMTKISGSNKVQGNFKTFVSNKIDTSTITSQQQLLKTVSPAVVGISANISSGQSIGTGVCINDKSYILTNNHVIENSAFIRLYLYNGETTSANVLWKDASLDLAILQAGTSVPYLDMAKENSYNAGEEVIAIGTPLALAFKHSATKGIISATNRTIQVDNDKGYSTLSNLIQHDASINPGNSGGPLINMKGEVLGINTVKVVDAEGMGFAIPVDTLKPVVKNISANGKYDTTFLGVFGYDTRLKNIFMNKNGYFVVSVSGGSPAEQIGIEKGDTILKINNKNISDSNSLRKILYKFNVGESVDVVYEHNGEIITKNVKLEKHPCCFQSQIIPAYN